MAYSYYRTVTLDHTKVGSTDATNFPVLVAGTYSYLATVANGGLVQNASGFDVAFYSDSALTTQLKHETASWNATTGAVEYWVKVPTVSHTTDTVIYMAYGNSGITTDQSDKVNVWDTNFKGVWHFPDGSTLTSNDSTTNANNLTAVNSPTAATGKIGGAAQLASASNKYLSKTSNATLQMGNIDFNVSAWVYLDSTINQMVLSKAASSASDEYFIYHVGGRFEFWVQNGASTFKALSTFGTPAISTWYLVRGRYNATTQKVGISVNNGAWDEVTCTVGANAGTNDFLVGAYIANSLPWNGRIDEARVSKVVRSADWETAEYNNQNSPSTFYTIGSQTATGSSPTTDIITVTGSWTCPSGVTTVDVELWGAGGGTPSAGSGTGGGGGAYSKKLSIAVTPGTSYTATVGVGATNTAGGDSWVFTLATVLAKGGQIGSSSGGATGLGGDAASGVGDIKYSGGNAGSALSGGGGGGGGAGSTGAGGNGSSATAGTGTATGGGNGGTGGGTGASGSIKGGGAGQGNVVQAGARGEVGITYTAAAATNSGFFAFI